MSTRGRRIAQFALLALAAGEFSSAAAQLLILSSGGPRAGRHYKPGSRLPNDKVFELRAGDRLVVLAAGGTRSWRGPGFYSLVAPARPLIINGQQVRVQTGVVRSAPRQEGVQPTSFWHYDIRQEGHLCAAEGARPLLWRPRSAAPARITLTAASGTSHNFNWPANQLTMEWPEPCPSAIRAATISMSKISRSRCRSRRTSCPHRRGSEWIRLRCSSSAAGAKLRLKR